MQIQSLNGYNTNFEKIGKAGKALGRGGKRKLNPYQNKSEKIYNRYMQDVQNVYNSCRNEGKALKRELDSLDREHKSRIDDIKRKPVLHGQRPFES